MVKTQIYPNVWHIHTIPFWFWPSAAVALLCIGVLLAWLCARLSALLERHRQNASQTVTAEYEAPSQLSAAELGYIIDATFGNNELLATIAQLYTKDAVQLRPLGADNFMITPGQEDNGTVDDAEASVLGYLRSLPSGAVDWKQLRSAVSDAAGPQADFEDAVLGSLVGKGLLYDEGLTGLLFRRRAVSMLVATAGAAAIGVPMYLWGQKQVAATGMAAGFAGIDKGVGMLLFIPIVGVIWLLWLMYINLLVFIYTRRDGIPVGATGQLRDLWPDVAGYRLFLQETEYVRLQHDQNTHDPAMAYCLALGLDPDFTRNLQK